MLRLNIENPHFAFLKNSADFILDLLFPIECLGCGKNDYWLCGECFSKLTFQSNSTCFNCGTQTRYFKTCSKCKEQIFLDGVWPASKYSRKIIERLIKTMKYSLVLEIAPILANFLSLYFKDLSSSYANKNKNLKIKTLEDLKNTIVIPVPLHPKRLRWRGFNQSLEIAKIFTDNLDLMLNYSDLLKTKYTKPQAKLKKEKRKENILNSFVWQGQNLKNKNIILIDDVSTSGSTLSECAKILKQNGAGEVWGLVVASG